MTTAATALRAAGFVPLPRLWVSESDMAAIHAIAHRHEPTVNEIRAAAAREAERQAQIERAWQQMKGAAE
jgi:hypothetical protein